MRSIGGSCAASRCPGSAFLPRRNSSLLGRQEVALAANHGDGEMSRRTATWAIVHFFTLREGGGLGGMVSFGDIAIQQQKGGSLGVTLVGGFSLRLVAHGRKGERGIGADGCPISKSAGGIQPP